MIFRNRGSYLDEMNREVSFLLSFYLFFVLGVTAVFTAEPLIFNPYTLQIYNSPDSTEVKPKIPYAVACPAESKLENDMNLYQSMDQKALFVRQYYYGVGESPLVHITCENDFVMAAVNRRGYYHAVEFGYEIYFKIINAPEKVYRSDYSKYGYVSEARSVWKEIHNDLMERKSGWPILGQSIITDELGFVWIPKIKLRYNASDWSFTWTKYTVHRNVAKELTITCNNYDLGNEVYKDRGEPVEKFYSPEEQKKIFSAVKIPELPEDSVCKTTGECVRKYDILKPYHFRSSFGSAVSCSNLTTIPIWYEVAEKLLNNLEIFLFALGQVTENPLTILLGVYDTLSFMTTDTRKPKPMEIYLYTKRKKIPVPKILYKIVRYKSHDCNVKEELCWFDIVIVIHNHPGRVKRHMICPKDKCKDYGWEDIKFLNTSKQGKGSEYIYCCKLDKKMQKKLDYTIGKELRGVLNLKSFPVFDQKQKKIRNPDRKDEIEKQMNKLQNEIFQIMKEKL